MKHLSFYRFLPLRNLAGLRAELRALGQEHGLLGTILLSAEGLNGMVNGSEAGVNALRFWLEAIGVTEIKEHEAIDSFERLLVKIKKEIISVGDPSLRPVENTAPRISAKELKTWLDEGRTVRLIDTRNSYEVEVGTFKGAEQWNLDSSRQFASKARAEAIDPGPVVTFCTGGIRCEKASALLQKMGWPQVYQLDGGILRYFEEVGAVHFEGNCFVFDWRMAVNGDLAPVPRSQEANKQFGRHKPKASSR
jgi:UPF0176 protein